MKMTTTCTAILALATAAFISLPSADAAVNYHVTVDTSALLTSPGSTDSPFALDFQLIGGDSLSNTVSITNFSFGGGAANGSPGANYSGSTVTGTIASGISLTDNSASSFNEFYQGFTPGSTLSFDVSLTTNVNGPTPDGFSFAILGDANNSLQNIDTNGPADQLLQIDLNSANPTAQVFSSTSGVTVSAVPEPGTMLFGLAMLGAAAVRRRRA